MDPKKLLAMLGGEPDTHQLYELNGYADPDVNTVPGHLPPALLDDETSATRRASPEQLERLRAPGTQYMELVDKAGAFSCGTCWWAEADLAECSNPDVLSPVSPDYGCCNRFWPRDRSPAFPESSTPDGAVGGDV